MQSWGTELCSRLEPLIIILRLRSKLIAGATVKIDSGYFGSMQYLNERSYALIMESAYWSELDHK